MAEKRGNWSGIAKGAYRAYQAHHFLSGNWLKEARGVGDELLAYGVALAILAVVVLAMSYWS